MARRTLWLGDAAWTGPHLTVTYGVDGDRFSTSLWWEGLDLDALADRMGGDLVRKLVFHVAAFEANKAASLRPDVFDLGPFADLGTTAFRELWSAILHHVWAQWRYENQLPTYGGPEILGDAAPPTPPVRVPRAAEPRILLFCGGGKDSLVSARVLEDAGLPYASYAYSHSTYGRPEPQHALIDGLLDHLAPSARERHWVIDDFLDAPTLALRPELGVRTLTAAETPSSVFGALPLALARGYTHLLVGHERSADVGNLTWAETGEEVNHQWGKSLDAEVRLQRYVQEELLPGVTYASVLKPVHDVLIFSAMRGWPDAVPATHSCNVAKPWCLRCAKCAYVWLGYRTYLPHEVVVATFGDENLLDVEEDQLWFDQMLGLADHTPFECIGQVEEARLAFELLRRRGVSGRAMDRFVAAVPPVDAEAAFEQLIEVAPQHHALGDLAPRIVPVLDRLAQASMPEG